SVRSEQSGQLTPTLRELLGPANEAWLADLGKVLTTEQMRRLRQIELQKRGLEALTEPELQRAVRLSTNQIRKVDEILARTRLSLKREFDRTDGSAEERSKRVSQLQTETATDLRAALSDQQLATWHELIGPPSRRAEADQSLGIGPPG